MAPGTLTAHCHEYGAMRRRHRLFNALPAVFPALLGQRGGGAGGRKGAVSDGPIQPIHAPSAYGRPGATHHGDSDADAGGPSTTVLRKARAQSQGHDGMGTPRAEAPEAGAEARGPQGQTWAESGGGGLGSRISCLTPPPRAKFKKRGVGKGF